MKNKFLLLFASVASLHSIVAGTIVIEGKYQDRNLYVQNGYAENGVGFCAYEVKINGVVSTDEVNSSAFEIDFTALQIIPGTNVVIEIKHKDGCVPKVLNPEVLKAKATFEVVNINIDKNGILNWETKNETGSLPYYVEQFRWNKWIRVGEVKGNGEMKKNNYSFQTVPHSGENKFRIHQIGNANTSKESKSIRFVSTLSQPIYTFNKKGTDIEFSYETMYEVYDKYGNIVKRGFGNDLDVANLSKGNYYLCYDNVMTDFKKK